MSKRNNITLHGHTIYIKHGGDTRATMVKVDRGRHPALYNFLIDNGERIANEFNKADIKIYRVDSDEVWQSIAEETGYQRKFSIWVASNFEVCEIAPPVPVVSPMAKEVVNRTNPFK